MNRTFSSKLALGSLLALGCGFPKTAAAPPALTADQVSHAAGQWPGVTSEQLASGREVFVSKCNGCHGYPDLASVSAQAWPEVMTKMGKKADLSPKQTDDALHFVLAARAETGATP